METFWDWVTVFGFAGLTTLLLQRSSEDEPRDKLWHYLPAAAGFGLDNYIGNKGYDLLAALLMVAIIAYIFIVLKVRIPPFQK